eukprot:1099656-Rhodomonas_salina.2
MTGFCIASGFRGAAILQPDSEQPDSPALQGVTPLFLAPGAMPDAMQAAASPWLCKLELS